MKIFDNALKKIRSDKRWFNSTLAVLGTALVAVVITLFLLPDAKANAIVDDATNKTMTYNIPAIVAQDAGTSEVIEVVVDVNDPEYKYYIVGDGNTYDNVNIVVNYNISESKAMPIYLDNVKIKMSKNYPILEFAPSANEGTNVNGSYKVIVKGDCELTSTYREAYYPVVQVEAIHAELYELIDYRGDQLDDITNFYDITETDFGISVEFTSYEFAADETKTNCSLKIVTAEDSHGAGIGTTSGDVNISADNLDLADGSGDTINDIGGQLTEIFGYPLKPGKQALYNTSGYAGDITISGDLKLTILGNGYGACIGGGGASRLDSTPKSAGKVTIEGGTIYLDAKDHYDGTYSVPAIGGGLSRSNQVYGANNDVVITGGSIYIKDNGIQFGAADAHPVNAAGELLYPYTADYIRDVDGEGKLVISSESYEEIYKADLSVTDGYIDVDLEYNSSDMLQLLTYNYSGFGHGVVDLDTNLYFYLPASPLCSIVIDDSSFVKSDIPQFDLSVSGTSLVAKDGVYWMPSGSEVLVTMKNIPSYIEIEEVMLTDIESGVSTDYISAVTRDDNTGNYTVKLRVASNYSLKVTYSSNITVEYDYGFIEDDSHNVVNNSPMSYELGQELILNNNDISCEDLVFGGWISELTGNPVDVINSSNIDSIMDDTGVIRLKATWLAAYTYDACGGEFLEYAEDYLPYGTEVNINITSEEPVLENYVFEGWLINGELCAPGYTYTYTPTKNFVITAVYRQSNFFVYIDASPNKFNVENVDIFVGLKGNTVSDANNLLVKNPDGTYMTKEIDGVTYYYAIVENEANVAIVITQKPGHIITGQNITIKEENGSQIVVGTGGSEDGEIITEFSVDEDNVFISTQSEFVLREYNITFYDGTTASGGSKLWSEDGFTYTIAELDKPLGEILGSRESDLGTVRNRFYEFVCWKDMLTGKTYTNDDALLENLGDVILVAQWNEIERYPINVVVVDESNGKISDDVFGIPYYENEAGVLEKAYTEEVDGETIAYAMLDDKVVIKFFYYDNYGVMKDVTGGVVLKDMKLNYTKYTGSNTTEEIAAGLNYFICPQPLADTSINVTATVSIQEYTIEYWDTKDMKHGNPTTYTFFDEIVLNNIYENVGWLLVTADDDDTNYDEIKTTPITKIERGTIGNIVLKADWTDFVETSYRVMVDTSVKNGILEIVYPEGRTFYMPNETLIIKAIPDEGYVLKDNVITYKDMQNLMTMSALNNYGLQRDTVLQGIVEVTGSDGIYLVNMPEKNIVITAVFEKAPVDEDNSDTDNTPDTGKPGTDNPNTGNSGTSNNDMNKPDGSDDEDESKVTIVDKNDPNYVGEPETETQKTHLVGGGNAYGSDTYTGDTSNVTRLILICVAAVLAIAIVVVYKGDKSDDDDKN